MGKKETLKNAVRLSVVFSQSRAQWLKQVAIRLSLEKKTIITTSEIIRIATEIAFPELSITKELRYNKDE